MRIVPKSYSSRCRKFLYFSLEKKSRFPVTASCSAIDTESKGMGLHPRTHAYADRY